MYQEETVTSDILISLGLYSFKGVKVGLDCANGSSWNLAKSVFDALGAKTYVINAEPDGTNINNNAGSTHIGGLQNLLPRMVWILDLHMTEMLTDVSV